MKTSVQYLKECIGVQEERGRDYEAEGTGERSFQQVANVFNGITGRDLKGSDVCAMLVALKLVRQYSNPDRVHEDSVLDMISYASLWGEELNAENPQETEVTPEEKEMLQHEWTS